MALDNQITIRVPDCLDWYRRCIMGLLAIVEEKNGLNWKQTQILSLLCFMQGKGLNLSDNTMILDLMMEHHMGRIETSTLRNYKTKLKNAGWLRYEGRRLRTNATLSRLIEKGHVSIGLVNEGCGRV